MVHKPSPPAETLVLVWDPFVRFFHWTFALLFFVAWFSEDVLLVHVWAGYGVGALLLGRLFWGVVGTRPARFSNFVRGPGAIWTDLRQTLTLRSQPHHGHGPAGGAMVVALLAVIALVVASGMAFYGEAWGRGPLAILQPLAGDTAAAVAAEQSSDGTWKDIHETVANLALILVFVHVASVLLASIGQRRNLVRVMWTGRRRP